MFSLRNYVYQIKYEKKRVNNSVCLWHCAISGEIVELFLKKYLPKNFDETGNSVDDQ